MTELESAVFAWRPLHPYDAVVEGLKKPYG